MPTPADAEPVAGVARERLERRRACRRRRPAVVEPAGTRATTRERGAARPAASATKAWPSRSARTATNPAPGVSVRESVAKPARGRGRSPTNDPARAAAISSRVRSSDAPRSPRGRRPGRRRADDPAAEVLARSRGPSRRSPPRRRGAPPPSQPDGRAGGRARRVDRDGSGSPASASAAMAAGSSRRGLSLVSTTRSARAARLPITGRFDGSRSPPEPNTTTHPVSGRRAGGDSAPGAQGAGRVRVVDDDGELLARRRPAPSAPARRGRPARPSTTASAGTRRRARWRRPRARSRRCTGPPAEAAPPVPASALDPEGGAAGVDRDHLAPHGRARAEPERGDVQIRVGAPEPAELAPPRVVVPLPRPPVNAGAEQPRLRLEVRRRWCRGSRGGRARGS